MSTAELRLALEADTDGTGEIIATVKSDGFAGRGSAWFSIAHVQETFIPALRTFPLSRSDPPVIEGGYWSQTNKGSLDQCHLRVVVVPYDGRGTLLVQVDLSTASWTNPASDKQQSVTTRFVTSYAALERFASELGEDLNGTWGEAVLAGGEPG